MARIRFIHEGEFCEVFGHTFRRSDWQSVPDECPADVYLRLKGNPTFETDESDGTIKAPKQPLADPVPTGRATMTAEQVANPLPKVAELA
jgi:hypothetical protein